MINQIWLASLGILAILASSLACKPKPDKIKPEEEPEPQSCFTTRIPDTCWVWEDIVKYLDNGTCNKVEELAVGFVKAAFDTCPNLQEWDAKQSWFGFLDQKKAELNMKNATGCHAVEIDVGGTFAAARHQCPENVMFWSLRDKDAELYDFFHYEVHSPCALVQRNRHAMVNPGCSHLDPLASMRAQNGMLCQVCRFIVNMAGKLVNTTEQHVAEKITSECSWFLFFKSLCRKLVTKWIKIIIDFINHGISLPKICYRIHLCTLNDIYLLEVRDIWHTPARSVPQG